VESLEVIARISADAGLVLYEWAIKLQTQHYSVLFGR
jgi:hypothetical protein